MKTISQLQDSPPRQPAKASKNMDVLVSRPLEDILHATATEPTFTFLASEIRAKK